MKLALICYICILILSNELAFSHMSKKMNKNKKDNESSNETAFKWNNKTFTFSNSCIKDCHKRGLCLDDHCYCDDGYIGTHCDRIRHKEVKEYFFLTDWILWIILSSVGVSLITLAFLFSCNK